MKAYIQSELVGDEDSVDIDCAILQCELQDAIFKALMEAPTNTFSMDVVDGIIWRVLAPYIHVPSVSIDFCFER